MNFQNQKITAKGDTRAYVDLKELSNLWFNTGTLCNLNCKNCYIESSPTNDRLEYIRTQEVVDYLEEIKKEKLPVKRIGLTGGEPFTNPHIMKIIKSILPENFNLLILTNGQTPVARKKEELLSLETEYPGKIQLRFSLDHHTEKLHERERGEGTFKKALESIKWFVDHNFEVSMAGRSLVDETPEQAIRSYQELLTSFEIGLTLTTNNLIIFPELIKNEDVPEISTKCWEILGKSPSDQMCASERMVVKRKGMEKPVVLPCTLLAYDEQFELGETLIGSAERVYLNHEFCAKFCVLGSCSCSDT